MENNLIPYETLEPATKGDLRAILKILKHYDPYITRLAMRPVLGTDGAVYLRVNDDFKQELQITLVTSLLCFDAVNG